MTLNRTFFVFLLVVVCAGWAIFTMRPEALLMAFFLVLGFAHKHFRRSNRAVISAAALVALAPFSPIGITLSHSPAGPKLVECCPDRFLSPEHNQSAKESAKRGECHLCSDVVTGFEPKRYIVW
ncbi:hypothetical protein [Acidovorax sp. GW101-3H11]|uniref:hypothetical protein n=1 Tax=Acidovorax sp. GW101-3H11 TaxID=1813946 RepID=UPI0010421005|nr:hypothetical protein [Acidovorax sp. GW101-3H11]